LDRVYGDLVRKSGEEQHSQLRVEYAALSRFHRNYIIAGLQGSVHSVDLDGAHSPAQSNRGFLASTEAQVNAREEYRKALAVMSHQEGIVVQNVVCNDLSLEIAGYSVGKKSRTRANAHARELLRSAGARLATLWRMA
jgi:hypothetical protein